MKIDRIDELERRVANLEQRLDDAESFPVQFARELLTQLGEVSFVDDGPRYVVPVGVRQ